MRERAAVGGFRAAQVFFVVLPASLLSGSLAAQGISYFFGDAYLDRFMTSFGPGSVWSVLFPIIGLFALFLVWFNSLGPVFRVRWPPSFSIVVATFFPMLIAWVVAAWLFVSLRTGVPLPPGMGVLLRASPQPLLWVLSLFGAVDWRLWIPIGYLFLATAAFGRIAKRFGFPVNG